MIVALYKLTITSATYHGLGTHVWLSDPSNIFDTVKTCILVGPSYRPFDEVEVLTALAVVIRGNIKIASEVHIRSEKVAC